MTKYVQVYYKHIIYIYTLNRYLEDSMNLVTYLVKFQFFSTIQRVHGVVH